MQVPLVQAPPTGGSVQAPVVEPPVWVPATGPLAEERTALAAEISRAALAAETGMLLEEARRALADPVPEPTATAEPPAYNLEAEAGLRLAVVAGADKRPGLRNGITGAKT